MELPALKVGKPRPTPVVRGGITNVWTNAIWKSQKLRKGEHIMKKEHSKYQWIIGIGCLENNGVKLYKYTGTVKEIKKRLLRLIEEDKKRIRRTGNTEVKP